MFLEKAGQDPATGVVGDEPHRSREKGLVAATSVVAAVALTVLKLVVGLATGSLGILSEALHSALDLVAALATLFAVRTSARPADSTHPFGHGKVENLSALFETILLLVTCGWIVNEAVERLATGNVRVQATAWAFVVMAISIVVDLSRSQALMKVARATGSQALEADALHFSTDVWSSSVVILGLAAVRLAPVLGMPWLVHADAVAALGVAAIVVWVSLRLGRRTIADLLDEVPPGLREQVEAAAHVSGVVDVGRVRVRRSGGDHFVDLTLSAAPGITLERAHVLADRVEHAVRERLPGADVLVHVEPVGDGERPVPSALGVQTMARREGLEAHAVHLAPGPAGPVLELHVEVEPDLDVATAHARVGELEAKLRRRFPGLVQIVSHLEPRTTAPATENGVTVAAIRATAERVAADRGLQCQASDVVVARGEAGLEVAFCCATDPRAAISEAHALTAALEAAVREQFPAIDRVTIHLRPLPDG